jgi:hypothetical protein
MWYIEISYSYYILNYTINFRIAFKLVWGSYPASLRNVGGSTQAPVRAWNNARKGTWGLPQPVKLESRHMTYTVSMWRKTQWNKQTSIHYNYSCFSSSIKYHIQFKLSLYHWIVLKCHRITERCYFNIFIVTYQYASWVYSYFIINYDAF